MKIAMFHELSFGGARRTADEFAKGLQKYNIVDYYYIDDVEDQEIKRDIQNVYFYQFNSIKWSGKNRRKKIYTDTVELLRLYALHKKIGKIIDEKKYDVVLIHPSKYTQAPFLLRSVSVRKIYYCQEPLRIVYDPFFSSDPAIRFPNNLYEKVNRAIRKTIDQTNIKHADVILANSQFSARNIRRAYDREAEVCYLGIDTNLFFPLKSKKEYDILFVGQKVVVEGYNLLKESLVLFAKKPKIKIIERDEKGVGIANKELVKEMNKAKVVVALSRNEPFGLLPLEAMACGVPVVAIKEGGLVESVRHKITGLLVPPDPEKIYIAIRQLLNNDSLRKSFGEKGRQEVITNWTWEKSVKRFKEIVKYEKSN